MKKIPLLFGIIIVASCAVKLKTIEPVYAGIKPVGATQSIQASKDTPQVRKPLTAEQLQAYLLPFYRANFDKLFAPKFDQLLNSNTILSESIRNQNEYQAETRRRTDSIAKERNYYRAEFFRMQKEQLKNQKEMAVTYKRITDQNSKITEQNARQIANMKQIINYLLTGFVVVVAILIMLAVMVSFVWRRNNRIYKQVFKMS